MLGSLKIRLRSPKRKNILSVFTSSGKSMFLETPKKLENQSSPKMKNSDADMTGAF